MDYSHCFTALTPTTFLERSARAYPRADAIVLPSGNISYAELLTKTRKFAELLRNLGVSAGDRVGILSDNNAQVIEAHFAIPSLLGLVCSFNPWLSMSELLYQIEFCNCKVILVNENHFQRHAQLFSDLPNPSGKIILLIGDQADTNIGDLKILNFEMAVKNLASDRRLDQHIFDEMSPIAINFTSGTTGAPKGVMFSHRAAYLQAMGQVVMMRLHHGSRYLWSLPMFHGNGWFHIWANIAIGAKQYIKPFGAQDELCSLSDCVIENEITHFAGAPRLIRNLLESSDKKQWNDLTIMTGGAAPPAKLVRDMKQSSIRLIHQYGLNETCATFTLCEQQDHWDELPENLQIEYMSRQGVPAIHVGMGLRVVDENGNEVPADGVTLGEVVMSGNTVALCYFQNEDATRRSFSNGWFHSGDLAVMHPDGYIEIKDRIKDLIFVDTDSGWLNISSLSVERIIGQCPVVKDVALVGREKPDSGKAELFAFVELFGDVQESLEILRRYCDENLGVYENPHQFYVTELPKTATGKVQKHLLQPRNQNEIVDLGT